MKILKPRLFFFFWISGAYKKLQSCVWKICWNDNHLQYLITQTSVAVTWQQPLLSQNHVTPTLEWLTDTSLDALEWPRLRFEPYSKYNRSVHWAVDLSQHYFKIVNTILYYLNKV